MQAVKLLFKSPSQTIIFGFAGMIILGALFLMLPQSVNSESLSFVDALFTSTSAVCVTGLTVTDTGATFNTFGQAIILFLIQIGGLGIMTLSTLFVVLAGRRLSFSGHSLIRDNYTHSDRQSIISILRDIGLFVIAFEAAGAIVLFFCFINDYSVGKSLYMALFHSVSAFCNAGFSLFSASFSSMNNNWVIMGTISVLIIAGGLGFPVLSELKHRLTSRHRFWSRLSLHSKLVISSTALLLLFGTLLILYMEWSNVLHSMPMQNRGLNAFFMSVNARTAGFNSVPVNTMANETLFILVFLMFIGASPGSCGGGIKTTTFSILVILGLSRFRGHQNPHVFSRTISKRSTAKAISIVLISVTVICVGTILLLMSELGGMSHIESRGKFLELLFEVVSAFATVGLSTGSTGELSPIGKLLISIIMFIGRVGPLVVILAVSKPIKSLFSHAEEDIMIG